MTNKDKYDNYNSNIYNIDNIVVNDDNTNIYYIYISIKELIENTKRELKKLVKELNIKIGGPQDVKAQQYDKIPAGGIASDIKDVYKQIEDINNSINVLKNDLNNLMKSKRSLENILEEISQVRKDDVKLKVFIGYYVKGKTLHQLSKELYRIDDLGRKQSYTYQYLRRINTTFTKKDG